MSHELPVSVCNCFINGLSKSLMQAILLVIFDRLKVNLKLQFFNSIDHAYRIKIFFRFVIFLETGKAPNPYSSSVLLLEYHKLLAK